MHMILLRGLLLLAASTQFITSDARSCTGKEDEKKTKTIIKNFNSNRNLFAQRDKHGTLGYGAMEGEVYEDQYWHFLPVSCEGSFAKSGPCYLIKNAFSNRRIYAESDKSGSKGVGGHTGKSVGQKWVLQESDCNGNKCFYIINAYSGRRLYAQRYDNGGEVGAYTGELYADQRWFIDVCEGCDRRNYQEGGNSIGFSYFRLPFCSEGGSNIYLSNNCYQKVNVAIRYMDPNSRVWKSRCWYNLDPSRAYFTTNNGQRISTNNSVIYVYAKSSTVTWTTGTSTHPNIRRICDGTYLSMFAWDYRDTDNDFNVEFTCDLDGKNDKAFTMNLASGRVGIDDEVEDGGDFQNESNDNWYEDNDGDANLVYH